MPEIPELLAPAGNLEKLKIALLYGADAVYCSGKAFGLRAGAGNLSPEELEEGVALAHQMGRRVYVTVNIIPHNGDFQDLPEYLLYLASIGVDALIVADPGVLTLARELVPHLPLHLSTQANAVNWRSVRFWQEQGVQRIILARELSREEIAEIRQKTGAELEVFVHGAMCMAYSGRCLLSMYLTGAMPTGAIVPSPAGGATVWSRRGARVNTWPWRRRQGHLYLQFQGSLPHRLHTGAGRAGFGQPENRGRMKSIHYVGTVTRVYRQALDALPAGSRSLCSAGGVEAGAGEGEPPGLYHRLLLPSPRCRRP